MNLNDYHFNPQKKEMLVFSHLPHPGNKLFMAKAMNERAQEVCPVGRGQEQGAMLPGAGTDTGVGSRQLKGRQYSEKAREERDPMLWFHWEPGGQASPPH